METVKFTTSDKKLFIVKIEKANEFNTLKNIIEDLDIDEETIIPIFNVESIVFTELLNDEISDEISDDLLFKLIIAANYLDNKKLLDKFIEKIVDIIKSYDNPEDLRVRFNIVNDFEGEELEQINRETEALKNM